MATALSVSHLALFCLALLHLLIAASSDEHYITTHGINAATTLPPLASVRPPASGAPPNFEGWLASSYIYGAPASASSPPKASAPSSLTDSVEALPLAADASDLIISAATDTSLSSHVAQERGTPSSATGHLRRGPVFSDHRQSTRSRSTISRNLSERRLIARQRGEDTIASPRAAPPCPRASVVHKGATAVEASEPAPRGANGLARMTTLLGVLPLLAVPLLPPPVAALVALSSLAARAEAWFGSDCSKLAHPTCAVYHYDNETGLINRRRPDPSLNAVCNHPLCHPTMYRLAALQAQQHGREDDPLMIYCVVRDLIYPASIIPWMNIWETHMPVGDPAAAAASGDPICYVELTHMSYREGYYIRCPNPYRDGRHSSCTYFIEAVKEEDEVIAAAVWEYRRLHYRDNVWPRYGTF